MIQIYGAGIAGSYLYNLLKLEGFNVRVFDIRESPDCRCAWGISYKEAKELYGKVGINIDDYILSKPKEVIINNKLFFKNKYIVIFDRRAVLEELWKEVRFEKGDAEIVVDATGSSRAVLPRIERDNIYYTVQSVERHDMDENIYIHMRKTGYAWAFPLGDGRWHIGAGDLSYERASELIGMLRETYGIPESEGECRCRARIRMLPPSECRPIVHGNVYGIGEAIGCVSGGGEGNAPSLRCAWIFYRCLVENELDKYEEIVLKEFKWIEDEQKFVRAVQEGKKLKALRLLPKVVAFESKRSFEHSVRDMKNLIKLLMMR